MTLGEVRVENKIQTTENCAQTMNINNGMTSDKSNGNKRQVISTIIGTIFGYHNKNHLDGKTCTYKCMYKCPYLQKYLHMLLL